jgi:hypothetical protein
MTTSAFGGYLRHRGIERRPQRSRFNTNASLAVIGISYLDGRSTNRRADY